MHLGRRVRRLRNAAGLTQAEVAAPFSRAYVSAIEGAKLVPSLPALVLIAAALGSTASELLDGVNFLAPERYTATDACSPSNAAPTARRAGPADR